MAAKVNKTAKTVDKSKPKVNKKTPAKKTAKKAPKPKAPEITDDMFMDWFLKQSYTKFVRFTKEWNEEKLKLKLEKHDTYDGWLNYFKTLPVNKLKLLSETGLDILPAEAYAALSFWRDMMQNPSRIIKIHKAGLTGTGDPKDTITALAESNDRYGVLKAIRNQLAARLQNNPGNRDTADLSKQLTEIMTQIADYERRLAPDKKTVLGDLLSNMPGKPAAAPPSDIKSKRPTKDGGGHRRTSFASRVTISDVKGKK
jgi:hypothetical protein